MGIRKARSRIDLRQTTNALGMKKHAKWVKKSLVELLGGHWAHGVEYCNFG